MPLGEEAIWRRLGTHEALAAALIFEDRRFAASSGRMRAEPEYEDDQSGLEGSFL